MPDKKVIIIYGCGRVGTMSQKRLYADVFMPVCEIFTARIGIALTTGKSSTTVEPCRF